MRGSGSTCTYTDYNNNWKSEKKNKKLKRRISGSNGNATNCHQYNPPRNNAAYSSSSSSSSGSRSKRNKISKSISSSSHPSHSNNKRPPPIPNYSHSLPSPNHQNTTYSFNNNKDAAGPCARDVDLSNSGGGKAEASPLPDKRILQLIIDILQRRDTYEIFAEPVDPNEVEDYYQIVKEPMDFGTMRAKLHEGMYHNLDQFKHDVFLITRNAMHFNSSATIYFRQARAIHELAKRVFHVLITAPQNFELKFSGTRRRPTRRTPTLDKPSAVTSFVSPKGITCSVRTSILGKNVRGRPWIAGLAFPTKRNYCGLLTGARDDQKSSRVGTDRRCTYRSTSYPFGQENDLVASKCFPSNPLVPTNGKADTNYRKSLLLFVNDLGPTAQMIAAQKIGGVRENYPSGEAAKTTGWGSQCPECEVPDAARCSSLRGSSSSHLDALGITASHNITGSLHFDGCTVPKTTSEMNALSNAKVGGEAYSSERRMNSGGCAAVEDTYTEEMQCSTDREKRKVGQNRKSTDCLLGSGFSDVSAKSTRVVAGDTAGGKLDENGRAVPVVLALEQSHSISNAPNEWRRRNKKSCRASAGSSQVDDDNIDPFPLEHDLTVSCCSLATEKQKFLALESVNKKKKKIPKLEAEERVPASSPFTFTLGFWKAQLNQINDAGRRH